MPSSGTVLPRLLGGESPGKVPLKLPPTRAPALLVCLFGLLILYPHFEEVRAGRAILTLLMLSVLLSALYAVSEDRRSLFRAALLAAPGVVLSVIYQGGAGGGVIVAIALQLGFLVYVVTRILGFVLRSGSVTGEKLCAALCVYLLLGICWSLLYSLQENLRPGSFSTPDGGPAEWRDLIYFSFVSLTTLGYGDVTPVTSHARSFAMLEATTGSFYLAVLVARLVSAYRPRRASGGIS